MLIAGAIDFVVFIERRNDYASGGRLRRYVSSVREVNGVDGRVLSSEVFAPGPDGRAVPHAPVVLPRRAGRARLPAGDGGLVSRLIAADPLLAHRSAARSPAAGAVPARRRSLRGLRRPAAGRAGASGLG